MKLIYRGNTYDYNTDRASVGANAPFQVVNGNRQPYTLIYRGMNYTVDPNNRSVEASKPASYDLVYRGVAYHVNRDAQGVTTTTASTAASKAQGQPKFAGFSSPRTSIAKVHKANLMQNVQRRLNVARERGDQELVRLLEAELNQITA